MAGESQHKHAVKQLDTEAALRDERPALEHHKDKDFSQHFSKSSTEARDKGEKDVTQQREAVIRPQQAGKIDFSSLLHSLTKFASDRTWPSGKASPQSPSTKSRREKVRRTGKCERGPQQLYRLSLTHPRSHPTIGIAYPQQKVSPPKDSSRGPVSGNYRFHSPALPEREAELPQDELSFTHCFQESAPGAAQNYTSQPPALQPQPSMDSGAAGSQLLLPDFQISGSNTWQSSDRTFSGANFGHKSAPLTDSSKSNPFVSEPFPYGYHLLEESASDAFTCEQAAPSQDFTDSLSSAHVTHSFPFGSGQSVGQSNTHFSNDPAFVPAAQSSSLSEDSASSDSSGSSSSSQQSEKGKDTVGQTDTSGSKRNCHTKDTAARTLPQGSVHYARTVTAGPGTQMHFPNKKNTNPTVNNMHRASVNFDKNMNNKIVNRVPHNWEGNNKTYQSNDQNTQYNEINDKFQFQNQSVHDQRSNTPKNSRMPWQQIRPSTALHQNRVSELSRQLSNQKLAYMVPPSEGSQKNSNTFQNSRAEPITHGSSAVSTFKVEMSHTQVCEAKNKTVYFGLNQPLAAPSSRNYSYPPLQVPPMSLMMVSPYESPLPSPVHNPASSSTCSSLSPASTSPVNFSSEDKPAPAHTFYHPAPAKSSSDLSSHQFHSDRTLPFPDRSKDNIMSYLPNNVHPKSSLDVNKTYIDSFGVEHHQPPPSYSAHQLATSLATANLDQLDVLLTCKQCDQNFNNLASFLGHKQYCSQHAFAQNELKELSKIDESKRFNTEPVKTISAFSNSSMSRCPSELHLSLLGLNKNGELIPESETKGESKDDSMKLNLFTGSGNLPVALPELEMEDAKLDSLITEALNGMGYQSDNAEIDSSFIDAFGDDELNNVKTTSTKQSLKTKECDKKRKSKADFDRSLAQGKYFYSDEGSPDSEKQFTECKVEKMSLNLEQDEKINIKKEVSHKNSRGASREKAREQDGKVKETQRLCKGEDANAPRLLLSGKFSERFQESGCVPSSQASVSPTSKASVKESKRKNTAGGSWSKELIHKIVQQKNKLHKLHVKGTKNLQFSLVMERLTPTVQNPAFGEYDYVSDSEDECEPVKIASQGRLNQSSRCKYTYTKECKWRARSDRDQAAWRHESKECFEVKKSEELSLFPEKHKLKRRSSRSSTSSDLSTTVSDGTNSPKSTDSNNSTNSDSERKTEVKKKDPAEPRTYERKLCKESSKLALTFTKSVKKYNSEKAASEKTDASQSPKKCQSQVSDSPKAREESKSVEKRKNSPSKTKEKLAFPGKDSQNSVDKNNQKESVKVCVSQSDKQCTEPLHNETQSLGICKKVDFNAERSRKSPRGGAPCVTDLSTSGAFDKLNDSALKEPITLVNDLDTHKDSSLCSSLMDSVCLSPVQPQDALIPKDTLHLMPYSLEPDPGLIKSPLSFDTSSMFGEMGGFDSGIYSDMPIPKEAFHTIENAANKKEEFDWSMIVSPVLPDEISEYKAEKSHEKKGDYNHISLSLPEKIIDYSASLTNCVSDDELEIKRIVNELENQLQTTKLESPALLVRDSPKPLQMSKFSPLRLSDESENDSTSLDMGCTVEAITTPITNLPSEPYTEATLPWASPFQFELIGGHTGPHTPLQSEAVVLEPLTEKEENNRLSLITTAREEGKVERDVTAETKEEALEQKRYAENLMKSLEVISDSIFKEEAIITEQKEPGITSLTSQQHQEIECQTTDAFETEDQSEREAITRQQNILSPPNINERKDEIEYILNESHTLLSESNDPGVCGIEPISSETGEGTENNSTEAVEEEVPSKDCISEKCDSIKPDNGPREVTLDPYVEQEAPGSIRTEGELLKSTCVIPEQLSMRQESAEAAEAVRGLMDQCDRTPLSPALTDVSLHTHNKDTVTQILTEQSNIADKISTHIEMNNNEYTQCAEKDNISNLGCDVSLELIAKYEPSSPILSETNVKNIDQSFHRAPTTDALIILCSTETLDSDCSKMNPFNEPLQHDTQLQFDSVQKQEILNVQDIKEQLPVDFMASRQNSPCRETEDSECLFMHVTQPSISALSTSNPAAITQSDNDVDLQRSPSSDRNIQTNSPQDKDDDHHEMLSAAEISPPHLDLGEIISKDSAPSPLSLTGPEASQQSGSIEKTNPMLDLKLSPLNYSSVSDEPPKLHQYDYIPISPVQQCNDDTEPDNNSAQTLNNTPELTPELTSSHRPAPINETQQLTCISFDVPTGDISLASELKSHLEDRHDEVKSITTEVERANSNEASAEDNSVLQNISDGPPTPKIICENETQPLPEPSDKNLTIETGLGSTAPKQEADTKAQNAQQCDICLMCFRTVPGLKRHKAMKHLIRTEKHNDSQNFSQQRTSIYDPTEKTHKVDSRSSSDVISEPVVVSNAEDAGFVSEEMHNETGAIAVDEPENPKVKKTKAKRSKNADANPSAEPFSDQLLNMIKTNILQAITPGFQNNALQERSKSPENQEHVTERAASAVEDFPEIVPVVFTSTSQSVTEEVKSLHPTAEHKEEENVMASSETCPDIDTDKAVCEDGHVIGQCVEEERSSEGEEKLTQEMCGNVTMEIKSEDSSSTNDSHAPPSCPPTDPPGISPDLKAIFDDDNTFTNLYPRDEEEKRKKCPRVYTKRNKKQKCDQSLSVSSGEQLAEKLATAFADNPPAHCQYETISIDDAIMLNMCHNSALKADAPPQGEIKQQQEADAEETESRSLVDATQSPNEKSSLHLSELNTKAIMSSDQSTCKTEEEQTGSFPAPLPTDPTEPRGTKSAQHQSIDIPNMNTTFQLPDIQFFDSNKDVTLAPPVETTEVEKKEEDKSNKHHERRGRKRQEGGLKVKDKQYKCKVCFSWFLTLGELNFHKLSHNPSPPPTCYMCVQRKFSSREQLRDHLWEKHAKNKSGIWTCGMCLKEISDVWMYNEHLREHATQFARRGQTQGSMLGISGIMQETAVKNFITSIMQHRPSKASRESSKAAKEAEKKHSPESATEEAKVQKVKSGPSGRPSILTPLEVLHKVDTPKNVEIHPNCKDPSRDCHHCGKQFPKPFKLQRHLVVHNLEKIFLCHKCPVSYQEAQDLKEHLKREHEDADDKDSKHTTLYTCELCADVMHVIKKSFICSTCNYTFSKKEQFDRHMEKHLLGGNKIFKFRGVLRPVKASASTTDDECDSPASKKRRLLSDSLAENSSDSGIASVSPLHQNSETQPSKSCISMADDSTQTTVSEFHDNTNNNVKTEDVAEDYSDLFIELEKCIHMGSKDSPKEEMEPVLSPNPDAEGNGTLMSDACDVKEENESVCIKAASKEASEEVEEIRNGKDDALSGNRDKLEDVSYCFKENVTMVAAEVNTIISEPHKKDEPRPQASKVSNDETKRQTVEQNNISRLKERLKPSDLSKSSLTQHRGSVEPHNDDKEIPKLQKKRKDVKTSHGSIRASCPATQENIDIETQAKKKFRSGKPVAMQRKSDGPKDYPVLSSMHSDIGSNKMIAKSKTQPNTQPKKSLHDSFTPKKSDAVSSLNGDFKAKKGSMVRPLHSPISKVPMNNSLNKSKAKMGVRGMDNGHSFRTAESQNHILSQLFGQKLTSFKIPLRKDTSETIN